MSDIAPPRQTHLESMTEAHAPTGRGQIIRTVFSTGAVAVAWVAVKLWSGFPLLELLAFVAPGIVAGVAMSWASHAFEPANWTWDNALFGATLGGTVLPPAIGFLSALVGTYGQHALVPVFVFGSWAALFAALGYGAVRNAVRRARRTPRTPVAHITRFG